MKPNSASELRLMRRDPKRKKMVLHCGFTNEIEVRLSGLFVGRPRGAPFPTAQLKVDREDFDADYFTWNGRLLVSKRMRDIMALPLPDVRFLEVDASASAALPRSMGYLIMEVAIMEDIMDLERSEYGVLRFPPLDHLFKVEADSIVPRLNVEPVHDLFYEKFFNGCDSNCTDLFCTESFALRILEAGCTGVRFIDPSRLGYGVKRRYRTLRGIEEHVEWDYANGIETTRLVQTIG